MILCSALYYPASLTEPEKLVRDNRFYSGKCAESFALWWAYVRKCYPDVRVVLFADAHSPVPVLPLVHEHVKEDIDLLGHSLLEKGVLPSSPKVTVVPLTAHSGRYFWPMQRNLVEAINLAYRLNEDLFYLDNDCFLNTDIRPLVAGYDFAAPSIAHHQMTADSVCTYISAARLHALDPLGIDLPSFLSRLLAEGPTETRMHTFQEGGLYKLFAYGKTRAFGEQVELSHLSCYPHFMRYLERNPLPDEAYNALRFQLASLDMGRLKGVEMEFLDMIYPTP